MTLQVPGNSCKVITLRQKQGIPQILSTSSHITQGAIDLEQVSWNADSLVLKGSSRGVVGESYKIYLYVPRDPEVKYQLSHVQANIPQFTIQMGSPEVMEISFTFTARLAHWASYFTLERK